MHELKRSYRITYDSCEGYYVVHTPKREVRFYKDEQGLPYIDLLESNLEATMMLLQQEIQEREETVSQGSAQSPSHDGQSEREGL